MNPGLKTLATTPTPAVSEAATVAQLHALIIARPSRAQGQTSILGEFAGDEIRIDRRLGSLRAGRDNRKQTAADPDEPAGREVLCQQVRAGVTGASSGRVRLDERLPAEYRVRREEVERPPFAHMRTNNHL
jgi:hypothetical protein